MRRKTYHKIIWSFAIVVAVFFLWLIWLFKFSNNFPQPITLNAPANFWGVTFSKRFASSLNLSWQDTYLATIDDLGVKNIRLPIYWEDVESAEGKYDFSDYDWLLKEGAKRHVKFILVIGRRLPRWPECHTPDWTKNDSEEILRPKITALLTAIVNHYKNRKDIMAWQVENEPLLDTFGVCPPADYAWLKQEVALVKGLDQRPIIITGSGELSDWHRESAVGDTLGITMYRVVWGYWTGYVRWPLPEWLYDLKLQSVNRPQSKGIIAELQAEPWAPNSSLDKLPKKESDKSFTLEQFRANMQYAINTHFAQTYLWGVEWWYLEKTRGRTEFWNEAKKLKW